MQLVSSLVITTIKQQKSGLLMLYQAPMSDPIDALTATEMGYKQSLDKLKTKFQPAMVKEIDSLYDITCKQILEQVIEDSQFIDEDVSESSTDIVFTSKPQELLSSVLLFKKDGEYSLLVKEGYAFDILLLLHFIRSNISTGMYYLPHKKEAS